MKIFLISILVSRGQSLKYESCLLNMSLMHDIHTPAMRCFSSHVAMPGVSDDSMLDATHVCLSLNFAPQGTKVFLVDSVNNAPIMKETADVRDHIDN